MTAVIWIIATQIQRQKVDKRLPGVERGGHGELLPNGYIVSVWSDGRFGSRWWWRLHNTVNVINTTERTPSKWLKRHILCHTYFTIHTHRHTQSHQKHPFGSACQHEPYLAFPGETSRPWHTAQWKPSECSGLRSRPEKRSPSLQVHSSWPKWKTKTSLFLLLSMSSCKVDFMGWHAHRHF